VVGHYLAAPKQERSTAFVDLTLDKEFLPYVPTMYAFVHFKVLTEFGASIHLLDPGSTIRRKEEIEREPWVSPEVRLRDFV
jgi:hypothetical protein